MLSRRSPEPQKRLLQLPWHLGWSMGLYVRLLCLSFYPLRTKFVAIVKLLALWALIIMFLGFKPCVNCSSPIKLGQTIQNIDPVCPDPQTTWDKWGVKSMKIGQDGKPVDISYNSWLGVAHKLMILDADKKDMTFAVHIDDRLIGHSPNITVNKQDDCGINPHECYRLGFSGSEVIVPAGRHTVRVEWLGNGMHLACTPPLRNAGSFLCSFRIPAGEWHKSTRSRTGLLTADPLGSRVLRAPKLLDAHISST